MASRLSRWSIVTVGGSALIAALLLSSNSPPIEAIPGLFWLGQERGIDATSARRWAIEQAINATDYDIRVAQEDGRLEPFRARGNDPRTLQFQGRTLESDPASSLVADSIWRSLPERHSEVRTVLLLSLNSYARRSPAIAKLRQEGICLTIVPWFRSGDDVASAIRSGAGECAYAEIYGWPGKGVRSWLDSLSSATISWSSQVRGSRWSDRWEDLDRAPAAWFSFSDGRDYYGSGGWYWSPRARSWVACVQGRQDQCVTAFGLAGTWPSPVRRYGYDYYGSDRAPTSALPYALFQELGADRFRTVWRSNEPIAVSYAQVTGRPIDAWLARWAQANNYLTRRDIWLSLSGWVGVIAWVSLLGAWGAVRFRERVVS